MAKRRGAQHPRRIRQVPIRQRRPARLHHVRKTVHRQHEVEGRRAERRKPRARRRIETQPRHRPVPPARLRHHLRRNIEPQHGAAARRERRRHAADPAAEVEHVAVRADQPLARQPRDDFRGRRSEHRRVVQRIAATLASGATATARSKAAAKRATAASGASGAAAAWSRPDAASMARRSPNPPPHARRRRLSASRGSRPWAKRTSAPRSRRA